MFLASILSSFLSFQFVRSGTANVDVHAQVCGLFCVLFMILCGFVQAKSSEFRSSSYDCSTSSMLWSPLLLFAMLAGFLETVHSPCFVRRLIALSIRRCRGFDPSGSHQLPITGSGRDQCSVTLRTWHIFLVIYTRSADREFLIVIGSFATSEWWA